MASKSKKEKDDEIVSPSVDTEETPSATNSVEEDATNEQEQDDSHKVERRYEPIRFDVASIPSYVQFDILPLPSNGECYPHKKGRIPVKYLTASEENIYSSLNMYTHGQIIDAVLKRCILDKEFDVDEMVSGDRDAVVLWLRGTAYGTKLDVQYPNPNGGDPIKTVVDLADFKTKEFKLKGDEKGWFDYTTGNGDAIKFRYLTKRDEEELVTKLRNGYKVFSYTSIMNSLDLIKKDMEYVGDVENKETVDEALEYLNKWSKESLVKENTNVEEIFPHLVTEKMIQYTMSVNSNTDKEFIRQYVENMRSAEAQKYRNYVDENTPGLDLSMEIEIPESEGGGSINTTFRYDGFIFYHE